MNRKIYKNEEGEYHRVNGPAIVWENGDYMWCYNDLKHRYYGHAWGWGSRVEYWIFGKEIR